MSKRKRCSPNELHRNLTSKILPYGTDSKAALFFMGFLMLLRPLKEKACFHMKTSLFITLMVEISGIEPLTS